MTKLLLGLGLGVIITIAFTFLILCYIINALVYYQLAKKANMEKEAWKAFIPIVQNTLFFHMIDKSGWYLLVFVLPAIASSLSNSPFFYLISVILNVIVFVLLVEWTADFLKRFGQNPLWTIAMLFPLVFNIFLLHMAFSPNVRYLATNRYQD